MKLKELLNMKLKNVFSLLVAKFTAQPQPRPRIFPPTPLWESTERLLEQLRTRPGNIIYALRGSGKTTALLIRARELQEQGPVVILAGSGNMCRFLRDKWGDMYGDQTPPDFARTLRSYYGIATPNNPFIVLADEPFMFREMGRDFYRELAYNPAALRFAGGVASY